MSDSSGTASTDTDEQLQTAAADIRDADGVEVVELREATGGIEYLFVQFVPRVGNTSGIDDLVDDHGLKICDGDPDYGHLTVAIVPEDQRIYPDTHGEISYLYTETRTEAFEVVFEEFEKVETAKRVWNDCVVPRHDASPVATDGGEVVDTITLLERGDDVPVPMLKIGRVEPRTYYTDTGEEEREEAEFVELGEPTTVGEIQSWGVEDYPERVQEEFFGGVAAEEGDR